MTRERDGWSVYHIHGVAKLVLLVALIGELIYTAFTKRVVITRVKDTYITVPSITNNRLRLNLNTNIRP